MQLQKWPFYLVSNCSSGEPPTFIRLNKCTQILSEGAYSLIDPMQEDDNLVYYTGVKVLGVNFLGIEFSEGEILYSVIYPLFLQLSILQSINIIMKHIYT